MSKSRAAHREKTPLTSDERRAVFALIILCIPLTLYWACYEQQGNTRLALDDWNTVVRYMPPSVDNFVARGNVLMKEKDFAGAAADYSRAIELAPGLTEAYYARAEAYGNLGVLLCPQLRLGDP